MSFQKRKQEIIQMFQLLNPSEKVDGETRINGATINSICRYEGGGYKRVMKWLEEKVSELPQEESHDENVWPLKNFNTHKLSPLYEECEKVMLGRNEKYGDSWETLKITTIANLIEMKMSRIANMNERNLDPKVEDEFIDAANYAIMGLYKFKNKP